MNQLSGYNHDVLLKTKTKC